MTIVREILISLITGFFVALVVTIFVQELVAILIVGLFSSVVIFVILEFLKSKKNSKTSQIQSRIIQKNDEGIETMNREIAKVTPEEMWSYFNNLTDIQAQKLVAPLKGRWIVVSGPLGNVLSEREDRAQLTFKYGTYSKSIYMYFKDKKWIDGLSVINHGKTIKVLGKIDRVTSVNLDLDNCEIVD